jgi:hypothetical protein
MESITPQCLAMAESISKLGITSIQNFRACFKSTFSIVRKRSDQCILYYQPLTKKAAKLNTSTSSNNGKTLQALQ